MEDTGFNFIDYIVIAVILLSTVFAFIRGFIKSFLSLFGWGASIYLTYTCFPFLKPLIEEKIKNPIIIILMGHTALLIAFLILFGVVNLLCATAVKGLTSGIIDRTLGAVFGIIRGIVILSFVFFVIYTTFLVFVGTEDGNDENQKDKDILPKSILEAKSYPVLKQGKIILTEFIPNSFYENFQKMYDEVSKKTTSERFIESAINKIEKNLLPDQISAIDKSIDELSLTESEEELERRKLDKVFNAYEKLGNKQNLKNPLRDDEVERIEKILKQNKNQKTKTVEYNDPVIEDDPEIVVENGNPDKDSLDKDSY